MYSPTEIKTYILFSKILIRLSLKLSKNFIGFMEIVDFFSIFKEIS